MQQIALNDYLIVELPEGATDITLSEGSSHEDFGHPASLYYDINGKPFLLMLPSDTNYQLIGRCSEVSEEIAASLVEFGSEYGYKSYVQKEPEYKSPLVQAIMSGNSPFGEMIKVESFCMTAKDSFNSYLQSHSLTPQTAFLLKKI